jgi:hypothetical protein
MAGRGTSIIEFHHVDKSLDVPKSERPPTMPVRRITHQGGGVVVHDETVETVLAKLSYDARRLVVALAQEALDEGRDSALDIAHVHVGDLVSRC